MDSIDKFIYINLKRRTDRNEHILKELKKYNIPQEKIERFEAVEHEKGALGCGMSHLGVMQKFRDSGDKVWCIFEDDHYFTQPREVCDDYVKDFMENEHFDVFLGCTARLRGNPVIGGKFIRAYKSNMTSFYIVKKNVIEGFIASNKQAIRTMRRNIKDKKGGTPIDVMWFNLMNIFFFITPYYKVLGAQLDGHSDILNKNKNYGSIIGIKIEQKLESSIESSDDNSSKTSIENKPSESSEVLPEESKPNLPALPELPKLDLENFKDSENINPSNDIQNP
jgi:glycosyl transferase family 25